MTHNDERAAFLRVICADPGDDTSRLVFADWLEERGEEKRAKYIRVGVGLRMPLIHVPGCLAPWGCDHHPDYNPGRSAGGPQWVWHRGFLVSIDVECAWFLNHAGAIFREHPVERVTLTDRQPLQDHGAVQGPRRDQLTFDWWENGAWDYRASAEYIPRELYSEMRDLYPDWNITWNDGGDCLECPGEAEALDALSLACVSRGRKLAGLPPLRLVTSGT